MPNEHLKLIDGNRVWVKEKNQNDPTFFERLSKGQSPEFLWIGCSDSRVPANEVTNTMPGDIFVHRNIANLVVNTDFNLMSVVQYAVDVLKVKHIIVCGHYGCGGVNAALSKQKLGLIDNWIKNIKDTAQENMLELETLPSKEAQSDRLVELSIIKSVQNLAKMNIIQDAWQRGQYPILHGFVYSIKDGILKDLNVAIRDQDHLPHIYQFDI